MKELRSALNDRGYALRLSTERKGETVTAKLELQKLEEEKSLMKLVASGRLEDFDLTLGFDAEEEDLWSFLMRALGLWETVKGALPLERESSE